MTSVVIVDDHQLFRSGVRAELDGLVDVLGDAATVEDAVRLVIEAEPDVVVLDVQMPGGGGVEVIRQVAERRPAQRFLALSVSDAPEDVIAVIRAGARGYVTKTISGPELADAVRRVADGDAVFSPRLAGFVLDAFAGGLPAQAVDPQLDQLSPREREVLRHIARGYMYKEIAQRLSISTKTVEAHVSAVLRKLQLSNRHELSRWAVERRLVDCRRRPAVRPEIEHGRRDPQLRDLGPDPRRRAPRAGLRHVVLAFVGRAVGVGQHLHARDAEAARQPQRPRHVVAPLAAGVAEHDGVAEPETERPQRIDAAVHAGQHGELPRRLARRRGRGRLRRRSLALRPPEGLPVEAHRAP